jgi:hypothetical protein
MHKQGVKKMSGGGEYFIDTIPKVSKAWGKWP